LRLIIKESQLEVKMEKNDDKMEKKKKPIIKSSLVDHTYYDYSTHELSEILSTAEVKQKCRVTFPVKLHAIISKPEYKHIICWQPHGRSWKVLDNQLLAEVVCKENFNHDSFSSFNRSVNGKISLSILFELQNLLMTEEIFVLVQVGVSRYEL
jgi:hypothetical protein